MTEKVVRFENCEELEDEEPVNEKSSTSNHKALANGKMPSTETQNDSETTSQTLEKLDKWKAVTKRVRTSLAVKNAVKPVRTRRRSLWRAPTETVDPFIQKFSTRSDRKTTPPKRKSSHKTQSNKNSGDKLNTLGTVIEIDSKELESDCTSVYDYETGWSATLKEIPRVLAPDGRFMYIWFYLCAFAIRYNLWVIIMRIAFPTAQSEFTVVWCVFDYFCDFLYLLDILICFRTGFLEEGIIVTDVRRVVKHYVYSKNFIADIMSVIPTDILSILYPDKLPILRLNRLIKSYKSFRIKSLMESHTSYPTFLRVFFLLHLMFLLINWNAGFYIMISRAEGFGTNAWVYPGNGSLYQQYLKSLYWSTLTLTAIGDLPSPATNLEYLYTIACYLCGVFMFATIVGNAGSIIVNRNASRLDFERQREGTNSYMRKNKVPKDLKRRVLMWYDYSWARGRIGSGGGDLNSLTLLPDKLKSEIALHVNLETLRKVTFLQKCQPEFLHDLMLLMKMRIFTPGDFICRKGEVAREMYVIIDGKIEVVGEANQVLKVLSGGDFFGEIGILSLSEGQNRRTADIRTVGYVECFVLSKEDVLTATRDYPEAQALLAEYGRRRLQGQSTCKDPRLVDMEDCAPEKSDASDHDNNGNDTEFHAGLAVTSDTRSDIPNGSAMPGSLSIFVQSRSRSSSSSSASLLTPLPYPSLQLQGAHLQTQGSQLLQQGHNIFGSASSLTGRPRSSSRAGLLDPLPARRRSTGVELGYLASCSLADWNSDYACTLCNNAGKSGGEEPDVTSSDLDSSIMRMMTTSCGEIMSKVRTLIEKRMEHKMDKLRTEIQTLKSTVTEKNQQIKYFKSHITTQDVELGAWKQAVQELEHERLQQDQEMRQVKEELQVLRDRLNGSTSTSKKRRQGTTISMTSLLQEDNAQC